MTPATERDAHIIPRYGAAGARKFAFLMPADFPKAGVEYVWPALTAVPASAALVPLFLVHALPMERRDRSRLGGDARPVGKGV